MNLTEAKARRSAGKTIREFENQVAYKRDRLNTLVFNDFADPVGSVNVTNVSLTIEDIEVGPFCSLVYVSAVVEANRFRDDEHLTDADVELVARAAFDVGRTCIVEEDLQAAVTATPELDLTELSRTIGAVLNFISSGYVDFEVRVVVGTVHEGVNALGFTVGPAADPEDFTFAPRAQSRLDELHLLAKA